MGLSSHLPSHHFSLRGLVVVRDSGSLPRVVRVLHAGRLVTSFEGRLGDDPRRTLLCVLRGSPSCCNSWQARDLAVPVGATIVPAAPGRLTFLTSDLLFWVGRIRSGDPSNILCSPKLFSPRLDIRFKAQRSVRLFVLLCPKIYLILIARSCFSFA